MTLINQLSSALNIKNESPNRQVALVILENPERLEEIISGMVDAAPALLGDCVEVLSLISEKQPQLIVPHVENLIPLLHHPKTRVRWEAMHTLAYLADLIPQNMASLLPVLKEKICEDESTIVRDYAITALGNYGKVGQEAANNVFPILKIALNVRDGKHTKLVLEAFTKITQYLDAEQGYLNRITEIHLIDSRGTVKKAAKQLKTVLDK